MSRRIIMLILSFLVIPIVLIVRVIRPFYWIRFGWFFGSRIGHFAFDVEYYLSERKVGLHPEKAIDVFFYRAGKPANAFFTKMIKRRNLLVYNWVEPLFIANNWIPGGDQHRILPAYDNYNSRDKNGLLKRVEPQLSFSKEENKMAHSFLKSIGIGQQKFVCMIIRDSAYLKNADYHNYRDVDIDTLKASLTDDEQDKFLRHIARRYFEIVSKVLRNRDPNHLFLGSRLHGQAIRLKPVFEVLGEYADVISVNYYHRWTPRTPELENWSTWSGDKPFVISEWYVKGEDSGYTNTDGAGGVVKTQVDRGRFYQNFTLGLLESKSCIGWFWHTYRDTKDLPNGSNKGFLSIRYEPFDDLVEMAREINTQVYPLTSYFDSQSRKN